MSRTITRSRVAQLGAALALALVLAGCCAGHVEKAKLSPLVEILTKRHDRYVSEDATLSDAKKRRYLRSGEILRRAVGATGSTR